jgi:hypothetical protein
LPQTVTVDQMPAFNQKIGRDIMKLEIAALLGFAASATMSWMNPPECVGVIEAVNPADLQENLRRLSGNKASCEH